MSKKNKLCIKQCINTFPVKCNLFSSLLRVTRCLVLHQNCTLKMQCYACVCTICKKHWWNRLCQQEAIFCPKMSRLLSWDFSPLQIKTSWVMKSKKRAKEKTLSTALTVTDHTVAVHYIFCNKMWQDVINKLTDAVTHGGLVLHQMLQCCLIWIH